jgi:recombination protein RecT
MLNGFSKTWFMTKDQILTHAKKYSKSFTSEKTPWKTEFDAMALKTMLRGLLTHYGFLSVEMMGAISRDIENDTVEDITADFIRDNANKKTMHFDGIDEAETGSQDPPKDDCPI